MSRFKSKLRLETLDGRVLPDATPLGQMPEGPSAQTNDVDAAPAVSVLDLSLWSNPNYAITLRFQPEVNGQFRPPFDVVIPQGSSPSQVASLIAQAFAKAGIDGVQVGASPGTLFITSPITSVNVIGFEGPTAVDGNQLYSNPGLNQGNSAGGITLTYAGRPLPKAR